MPAVFSDSAPLSQDELATDLRTTENAHVCKKKKRGNIWNDCMHGLASLLNDSFGFAALKNDYACINPPTRDVIIIAKDPHPAPADSERPVITVFIRIQDALICSAACFLWSGAGGAAAQQIEDDAKGEAIIFASGKKIHAGKLGVDGLLQGILKHTGEILSRIKMDLYGKVRHWKTEIWTFVRRLIAPVLLVCCRKGCMLSIVVKSPLLMPSSAFELKFVQKLQTPTSSSIWRQRQACVPPLTPRSRFGRVRARSQSEGDSSQVLKPVRGTEGEENQRLR